MKKVVNLILTLAFVGLFAFNTNAQEEANKAIELYNQTVQAVQAEDYATAIAKSKEAYAIAKTAEGAEETKTQLEKMIPQLYVSKAKKDLADNKFDEALETLVQAENEAKNFNDAETLKAIPDIVAKVHLNKAEQLFANNDFDGAIALYDKVLETDKDNAQVHFLKSTSLMKKGDLKEAAKSFEETKTIAKATTNSEVEKNANTQLVNIYNRFAGDAQKNKKWADVVSNAEKSLTYQPNDATAIKLADVGYLQQALALQQTDKTKACQFLKKIKGSDPKITDTKSKLSTALGCK